MQNEVPIAKQSCDASAAVYATTAVALKLRYSREEAALALGISLRQVDRRVAEKQIIPIRDGGRVLFTQEALMQYAKRNHRSEVVIQ